MVARIPTTRAPKEKDDDGDLAAAKAEATAAEREEEGADEADGTPGARSGGPLPVNAEAGQRTRTRGGPISFAAAAATAKRMANRTAAALRPGGADLVVPPAAAHEAGPRNGQQQQRRRRRRRTSPRNKESSMLRRSSTSRNSRRRLLLLLISQRSLASKMAATATLTARRCWDRTTRPLRQRGATPHMLIARRGSHAETTGPATAPRRGRTGE
jgi:hypothetical protein